MTEITLRPIGRVHASRAAMHDDHWDRVHSVVRLDEAQFSADAIAGLDAFSHLEVVFWMDRVPEDQIQTGCRHPRDNPSWPKVGIFAQRGKGRPNRIGTTICRLDSIHGLDIRVVGLDAIDQTPVLDLKPWVAEFGPRSEVRQPSWMTDLMRDYW
jgi:tRNA-Thr(GGU) m(6)t(6)A37 methyltransferase TsaA